MMLKNKKIKINILIILGISLIFNIIYITILNIEYDKYNKVVNDTVNSVINNIYEKNLNINEEDIINILNDENIKNTSMLSKYGYNGNKIMIRKLEKDKFKDMIINISILILFELSFVFIYCILERKNNKRLTQIKEYIKQINNKNYTLNIEDNGEDELSKLRNELYKITVSLKEASEISMKEKEQLTCFIADISHQLKTPLTSIRIMLDNIEENPKMDDTTKMDFVKEISKQIDWISSLVISLLKLAKFDAGVINMNKTQINVKELFNNVIDNLLVIIDIKNIEIKVNIPDKAEFIGDYKWEMEAFTNIIKNSIEHSMENSKIYVDIEDNSLFLKIQIRDEGEGIEKEDLKHIFERFYKSQNASENSMGIGLSLAKSIIEKDNGYISAYSNVGKGTIFEIKYIK